MATEWFDAWFDSPYYQQLYSDRNSQEAEAFIGRLVQHLQPPPSSTILDVACGTGRHSLQLANLGFDVTGIDLSHASIKIAKVHENDRLHYFQHDMRQPFRINYFNYAFNFFTSFGYFRTLREHQAAMRTIAHSLQKDGILVMDYLNTPYAAANLIPESEVTVGEHHFRLTRWMDETHFYKKIEVHNDALLTPEVFEEKVAKFSVGNFNDMFGTQGLVIIEIFGDYNLNAFDALQSPRMIIIAKKAKNN